jgi:signal transduction histidine kinase
MAKSAKTRILVVDDNPENRALATATLEDEDYEVYSAASGEEGLSLFSEVRPACVLLDVRMPDLDGFATCLRLRKLRGGKNVPVLFLTAQRDLETFERALQVGGDDFLTKPLSPKELVIRIQTALKLRHVTDELREHYEVVRRQRDDLMRLQLQKEQLTSFVIHDLKNPVNAVDLHAQLLLRRSDLSERSRASVQQIREEMRSLMRLVLNLLDINKSDEGALSARIEKIDLAAMVGQVLEEFQPQAASRSVSIEPDLEALNVHADADLLRRVMENLIDNAIRHTPESGRVALRSRALSGAVLLQVTDEGPGIPPDLRERIFGRFARLDHATERRAGRGLGLQFCRLAVEAHGGSIWVEDAEPGTAFCVRLPPSVR